MTTGQPQPHDLPLPHVCREKRGRDGAAMIFTQCSNFTEEEEFIFLLLLLDSGLFYVLNSVSRWILLQCNQRVKILMVMLTDPTSIIRFWPQQRLIAPDCISFDLFSKSYDWCLEFLRFTYLLLPGILTT